MSDRFLLTLSASALIFIISAFMPLKISTQNAPEPLGEFYETIKENDLSGAIDFEANEGIFEGQPVQVPLAYVLDERRYVLGANNANKWIEVDLSEQKLRAWEGDKLFFETLVSTGLPYFPTPQGEFNIWIKLRATRMRGGTGKYAYDLPNVPYTMFFANADVPTWKGYGIHGAYWHNQFGTVRSHGCVNLPVEAAKQVYYWASPELPEGKSSVRVTPENPGTRVVIHS